MNRNNSGYEEGIRVSRITLILNVVLAIIKIFAGILGSSSAMMADGIHTMSDVATTVIVLVGLRISSKKADDDHPYGHQRFEAVFAKALSIILLLTGIYLGYEAIQTIRSGDIKTPGMVALIAAIISVAIKEFMYRYTMRTAKEIRSISMEADAWHHRSDAFSSIGTFIGILGARLGLPVLDPIAGLVVAALIIKVGVDLYMSSVSQLVDEAADDKTVEKILEIAKNTEGVLGINDLKTRISANQILVDMDIHVSPDITVKEGHEISTILHDNLMEKIEDISYAMIHIEPYSK